MEEVKKQGMESLFCPYELALELKKLGFDEGCFGWWSWINGITASFYTYPIKNSNMHLHNMHLHNMHPNNCSAPLWQQAFDWFRKKFKLLSFIDIDNSYRIYHNDNKEDLDIDSKIFNSYEEAELECLKKLIEIVKEQNVK